MATDLTAAQLWGDIIAAHKLAAPPDGALCVVEFAMQINKSEKHARDILNAYVRAGKMESGEFKKQDGKKATYYWPI